MAALTTAAIPAFEDVRALAGLGPRLAGGAAANEAARYVAHRLALLGLAVREERLPWPAWRDAGSTVEARGHSWPAVTGTFSPPADLFARVKVVRDAAELAASDAAGRIVVVAVPGPLPTARALSSGLYTMLEPGRPLVAALRVSGAAALVTVAPDDVRSGRPLTSDPDLPMPHVSVSASVGRRLASATRAHLVVRTVREPGASVTVSALSPGATAGVPRVVLLAHLDSAHGRTGVWDNASGVATVLAAAERLMADRPDVPFEVLVADGEEQWGAGVLHHVSDPGRTRDVAAVVNVDGVGLQDRPTTVAPVACPRHLVRQVVELVGRDARAHPWLRLGGPWWHGDHYAYVARGIPAVAVTSGAAAPGRTVPGGDDQLARLDGTRLAVTSGLVAEVAAALV